jgi:hypothetical protein
MCRDIFVDEDYKIYFLKYARNIAIMHYRCTKEIDHIFKNCHTLYHRHDVYANLKFTDGQSVTKVRHLSIDEMLTII